MLNPKKGCTKAGLLDENGRYLQNLTDAQKMVTVPLLSIVAHRMAFLDVQTYIYVRPRLRHMIRQRGRIFLISKILEFPY